MLIVFCFPASKSLCLFFSFIRIISSKQLFTNLLAIVTCCIPRQWLQTTGSLVLFASSSERPVNVANLSTRSFIRSYFANLRAGSAAG